MSDTYKAVSKAQGMGMFCTACYSVGLSEKGACPGVRYCKMLDSVIGSWFKQGMIEESPVDKAKQLIKELDSGRDNSTVGFYEAIRVLKEGFEYLMEERENR